MLTVERERHRAVTDFLLLDILILARVPMSIGGLRQLIPPLVVAAVASAMAIGAAASALVVAVDPAVAPRVGLLVVAAVVGSGGIAVVSGMVGVRRFAVSEAPHRGLLRAVDAPVLPLFLMAVVWRAGLVFGCWFAACAGFAVGVAAHVPPALVWLLLVAPLSAAAASIAVGAWAATRSARLPIRGGGVIAVGAAVAAGWLGAPMLSGGPVPAVLPAEALVVCSIVGMLVIGAAAVVIVARLRVLVLDPFPVVASSARARARIRTLRGALESQSGRFLRRRSAERVLFAAWAVAGFAVGLRFGAADGLALIPVSTTWVPRDGIGAPWIPTDAATIVRQVAIALVSTASALILETWVPYAGPARSMPQLRFAWEAGASRPTIVSAVFASGLAPLVLLSTAGTVCVTCLSGTIAAAVPVLLVPVAAGCAAILADATVRPVHNPDGTSGQTALTGIVAASCSAPVVVFALLADLRVATAGASIVTIVLGGAAAWRLAYRVRRRSS